MKLVFGDKESVKLRDTRKLKLPPKLTRYLSNCCGEFVKRSMDWERPFNQMAGVTEAIKCSKCEKDCFVVKQSIY